MSEAVIYNELNSLTMFKGLILFLPVLKWYIKNLMGEIRIKELEK